MDEKLWYLDNISDEITMFVLDYIVYLLQDEDTKENIDRKYVFAVNCYASYKSILDNNIDLTEIYEEEENFSALVYKAIQLLRIGNNISESKIEALENQLKTELKVANLFSDKFKNDVENNMHQLERKEII